MGLIKTDMYFFCSNIAQFRVEINMDQVRQKDPASQSLKPPTQPMQKAVHTLLSGTTLIITALPCPQNWALSEASQSL